MDLQQQFLFCSVTTGDAGTDASVTNTATSSAAVFNFTIPRGAEGTNGTNGTNGTDGSDGADNSSAGAQGPAGTAATMQFRNCYCRSSRF